MVDLVWRQFVAIGFHIELVVTVAEAVESNNTVGVGFDNIEFGADFGEGIADGD